MREQKKRKERAEWKVGPMCHVDATSTLRASSTIRSLHIVRSGPAPKSSNGSIFDSLLCKRSWVAL